MKKKLVFVLVALLAATFLAGCGTSQQTDSSWADIQAKGHFILGLDDSFPPMGFHDENTDEIVGFDIDLARECAVKLSKYAGKEITVKIQPLVWDFIAEELNTKKVDVIWNGCTITDERKKKFDFTKPYLDNEQVVVVLASSPIQSLDDLKGKKMGIQGGSSAIEALDKHPEVKDSLSELVEFSDNTKALMDLDTNRLDAVTLDVVVFAEYNLKKPNTYRRLDTALGAEQFGVGIRKSDVTFKEQLQKALDECESDGTTQKLKDKWFK